MQATRALWHRQPMIKFLGRRTVPKNMDHTPKVHPESPAGALPDSFAQYRQGATQHGPLKPQQRQVHTSNPAPSSNAAAAPDLHGIIGSRSAKDLGPIRLGQGEFRDRSELPPRFHRIPYTQAEIDAIESGGASSYA